MRLVDLLAAAPEGVAHLLLRPAEVGGVDVAFLVEHLEVAQRHRRPRGAAHPEPHVADHVLTHVDDRLALRRLQQLHRPELLDLPHRRAGGGDQGGLRRGCDNDDSRPSARVVARRAPAGPLEPCVVRLAHVDVRHEDGTGGRGPRPVGAHRLDPPVFVLDPELGEKSETLPVDVAPVLPGQVAAVPAVAEGRPDRVLAGAQVAADVVRLVLQALAVARPARREDLVAHTPAVDLQLVEAEARRVDARPPNRPAHRERAPQQRRRLRRLRVLVPRRLDPLRLPVGEGEQAHLPEGGRAPVRGLPAPVPDAYPPRVPPRGLERGAAVGDMDRPIGSHPTRVPHRLPVARDLQLVGGLDDATLGDRSCQLSRGWATSIPRGSTLDSQRRPATEGGAPAGVAAIEPADRPSRAATAAEVRGEVSRTVHLLVPGSAGGASPARFGSRGLCLGATRGGRCGETGVRSGRGG